METVKTAAAEEMEKEIRDLSDESTVQSAIFTDEGKDSYIKRLKDSALSFHKSNVEKSLKTNTTMIRLFEALAETTSRIHTYMLSELDKGNKDIKLDEGSELFSLILENKEDFDKYFKEKDTEGSTAIINNYLKLINSFLPDIVIVSLRKNHEIQSQKIITYKKAKIDFQDFLKFATEEQFNRIIDSFSNKRNTKRLFDSVNKPLQKKTGITTKITNALVSSKIKSILSERNETTTLSNINVASLSISILLCRYALSKFNDNTSSRAERSSIALGLVHGGTDFECVIESFWDVLVGYMDKRFENWKSENNVPEENEEVEESTVATQEEIQEVETEAASQEIILPIEEESETKE